MQIRELVAWIASLSTIGLFLTGMYVSQMNSKLVLVLNYCSSCIRTIDLGGCFSRGARFHCHWLQLFGLLWVRLPLPAGQLSSSFKTRLIIYDAVGSMVSSKVLLRSTCIKFLLEPGLNSRSSPWILSCNDSEQDLYML